MGGFYRHYNKCTKTSNDVINVLRSNYPAAGVPDAEKFDACPDAEEQLTSSPVYCVEYEVAIGAWGLLGEAGLSGVNGTHLKNWLLRFKVSSESLR